MSKLIEENKPKISILCPAFNHEKYVNYFIESVLKQTEQNFELVIIDDCSSDNTVLEILKYTDQRIKLIKHNYNRGINATLSELIQLAKSDIISVIASDDILYENYVEETLKIFEENQEISVVYVSLQMINMKNEVLYGTEIKMNTNFSREELLRNLFLVGNVLPSPGMSFKKSIVEHILPLPYGLIQYSDYKLHIDFLLKNNIKTTDKFLIKYRITDNSASSRSDNVVKREILETNMMMESFLRIDNVDFFKSIFKGECEKFGEPILQTIPYFLARIALTSGVPERQKWGYSILIDFISKDDNFELIHSLYNIDFRQVIDLVENCDFDLNQTDIIFFRRKIKKYKRRYILLLILLIILSIILIFTIIFILVKK